MHLNLIQMHLHLIQMHLYLHLIQLLRICTCIWFNCCAFAFALAFDSSLAFAFAFKSPARIWAQAWFTRGMVMCVSNSAPKSLTAVARAAKDSPTVTPCYVQCYRCIHNNSKTPPWPTPAKPTRPPLEPEFVPPFDPGISPPPSPSETASFS